MAVYALAIGHSVSKQLYNYIITLPPNEHAMSAYCIANMVFAGSAWQKGKINVIIIIQYKCMVTITLC